MYDLSNPNDVIQQMRDADLSDAAITKTLKLTLEQMTENRKTKYQVTVTGTVDIIVNAISPEVAEELALATELGGELRDWEIENVTEVV